MPRWMRTRGVCSEGDVIVRERLAVRAEGGGPLLLEEDDGHLADPLVDQHRRGLRETHTTGMDARSLQYRL